MTGEQCVVDKNFRQRPPDPLAGGEGLIVPTQEFIHAVGPSGFGPSSLA